MTTVKDFQVISKLGEGAYSSVYKVKRLTDGQEYALKKVKLMNLSDKEKQNALNEVRILASIKHPNVISYKEAFLEETSNSLCIIMEYANNGDLFQKICEHQKKGTTFSEAEIWSYFIQMTKALKSLHDFKIFHRDLKSANVFLNKDGTIKLGDLNVSKIAKKGLLYTQTGTPYYASPEVWRDMPYDNKADVWSLGCVLYEITTLKPPFRAEDMEGLYKKVLRGYYPRIPTSYSQDLSNVIRALLQVSPHLRPSCDRILQLPALVKRLEEKHLLELEEGQQISLLNTIRIPKNLHFLAERLPKANYTQVKIKKVDKNKFLQTLAGYKDSSNQSLLEDGPTRGSESVDSYKKEKENGRVYLPPVGKEGNPKEILKIYGAGKDRKEPAPAAAKHHHPSNNPSHNPSRVVNGAEIEKAYGEAEGENPRRNEPRRKKHVENEVGHKERDRSVDRSIGRSDRKQSSGGGGNRGAYKIHDGNPNVQPDLSNLHIRKSNPKIAVEPVAAKDPIHMMLKRQKQEMMRRSPSQDSAEYDPTQKKPGKLPILVPDKYGKLPPLNGERHYENSASPKKNKIRELTKVYKVNIGNLDDISDKYSVVNKPGRKEKLYPMGKNYGPHPINPLGDGISGVKYGKPYDF